MAFIPDDEYENPTQTSSNFIADPEQTPQRKVSLGQKVLDAGTAVSSFIGAKGLTDLMGSQLAKLNLAARGDIKAANLVEQPSLGEVAGSALQTASIFTPVGRVAKGLTTGANLLGIKMVASAIGKVGAGALAGYSYDVGRNISEGKSGTDILAPGVGTAFGAGVPAVGVGLNVAGRVAKTVAPKLLSYTSDVPEKAFEQMLQRREPVTAAIKGGMTGERALQNTQGAVRQLRTTLTAEWDDATKSIYDEFSGKRWGMGQGATKLANKVADDFGIELPQNLSNMSAKESLDLLKEVNELYSKRAVKESAEGIAVRKFKDFLKTSTVKNFGGESGSVAQLYNNYSAKKGVLDAANDIVRAYSTGKPIQQSTALGRLKALFNENKSAYLDAILDLEKATGRDLLSGITAVQFEGKLPGKLASVSSSGGLQAPKGVIDKAISLLLLPLSSPRSAGFISRNLSKVKSPAVTFPGDKLLDTPRGKPNPNSPTSTTK